MVLSAFFDNAEIQEVLRAVRDPLWRGREKGAQELCEVQSCLLLQQRVSEGTLASSQGAVRHQRDIAFMQRRRSSRQARAHASVGEEESHGPGFYDPQDSRHRAAPVPRHDDRAPASCRRQPQGAVGSAQDPKDRMHCTHSRLRPYPQIVKHTEASIDPFLKELLPDIYAEVVKVKTAAAAQASGSGEAEASRRTVRCFCEQVSK